MASSDEMPMDRTPSPRAAEFERLLDALRKPWEEAPGSARYAQPAPADVTAAYQTFCGT